MGLGIVGKKLGMGQIFDAEGRRIPVTLVEANGCVVTAIKTAEKHGYNAVQVGFGNRREKSTNKSLKGFFTKNSLPLKTTLREFRISDVKELEQYKVGQPVTVDLFKVSDKVDVTGVSKGKGYAGVMKRHGFKGGGASHGAHQYHRHGGSIGCRYPQHTPKGRRMAGHMGSERVTVQRLSIADVKTDKQIIYVEGAIPGSRGDMVLLSKTVKN